MGALDALRRRGHGLEVGVTNPETCRGEEVDALVTVSSIEGLGEIEAGLVCTEYYAEEVGTHNQYGSSPSTVTSEAIAHEEWLPIESAPGVHSVRLPIPLDAPFSYEGNCLSFKWEVVARGRRKRRLDAQAKHELSVAP
jgi:hypothetical protein